MAWIRVVRAGKMCEQIQESFEEAKATGLGHRLDTGDKGRGISVSHYPYHLAEESGPEVCDQHILYRIPLTLHVEPQGIPPIIRRHIFLMALTFFLSFPCSALDTERCI